MSFVTRFMGACRRKPPPLLLPMGVIVITRICNGESSLYQLDFDKVESRMFVWSDTLQAIDEAVQQNMGSPCWSSPMIPALLEELVSKCSDAKDRTITGSVQLACPPITLLVTEQSQTEELSTVSVE